MEIPDPPSDTPGASIKVFLTPLDIPRILRVVCICMHGTHFNQHHPISINQSCHAFDLVLQHSNSIHVWYIYIPTFTININDSCRKIDLPHGNIWKSLMVFKTRFAFWFVFFPTPKNTSNPKDPYPSRKFVGLMVETSHPHNRIVRLIPKS